jgi:hypothetical protein
MVHNGRTYTPVTVSQDMVGHKLGEFSHTRKVFTYKCVLPGSLSPWRAADGTGRQGDEEPVEHCGVPSEAIPVVLSLSPVFSESMYISYKATTLFPHKVVREIA